MGDYQGVEPEVVRLAREFRDALNSGMDYQVYALGEKWVELEGRVSRHISELLIEIENRFPEGDAYENAVRELARYKGLREEIHREMLRYNFEVERIVKEQQLIYAGRGLIDSANLISAVYRDAGSGLVGSYFNRLPVGPAETMMGFLTGPAPLSGLLEEAFPGAWVQVSKALFDGIALGYGPKEIATNMVLGLGFGFDRAMLIARTEVMRAYRMASVEQYRMSGVTNGFRRLVAKDGACPACLASDGEYFELASYFTDHPNGRCTCVPIVKGMPRRDWFYGPDWFLVQEPEKQRSILGGNYYEAWRAGLFKFEDLRMTRHSDIWGDSPAVKPLKELVGENWRDAIKNIKKENGND